MKLITLLLAGFISFGVVAKEITIQKAFGYNWISCQILGDVGKRTFSLKIQEWQELEDEYSVRLELTHVACARVDGKFVLEELALDKTAYRPVLDANGELAESKVDTIFANFAAVDRSERIIKKYALELDKNPVELELRFSKSHEFVYFFLETKSKAETPEGVIIPDIFDHRGGIFLRIKESEESKN